MKTFSLLAILTIFVLAFQNCGEMARNTTVFTDQYASASADSCQGIDCTPPEELLWLKILEYEPYKIQFSSITAGHFNIAGQCGVSTFPEHSFVYELRQAFGSEVVVGRGFIDNRCDLGQFSVPITANLSIPLQPDRRYRVSLELIGITRRGEQFTNPNPVNQASLEVIFTSE